MYKYWTWDFNSATDPGFHPTGDPFDIPDEPLQNNADSVLQCVSGIKEYSAPKEIKAIHRVSRTATEWTFKWCGNQVEKGFTGEVVPPCRYTEVIPVTGGSEDGAGTRDEGNRGAKQKVTRDEGEDSTESVRIRAWLECLV